MQPYLAKGWELKDTHNHADPDSKTPLGNSDVKPDLALYAPNMYDDARPCRSKTAALFGEAKILETSEPFRLPLEASSELLERKTEAAHQTRGQLTVYHNAIQAAQQRTRVYSFYYRKNFARLLCHSRSGTEVTPLIDMTKSNEVHEFFWRYTRALSAERGLDTTFERAPDDDPHVSSARTHLFLKVDDPVFKVSVGSHVFYISSPFTTTHGYPVGRGTRCYEAYNPVNGKRVLLKDTWRYAEYPPEHEIYEKLRDSGVSNVLRVVAWGDVEGPLQTCGRDGGLRELIHYRIVLDEVGKSLTEFDSTHQFITVIRDALRGSSPSIIFDADAYSLTTLLQHIERRRRRESFTGTYPSATSSLLKVEVILSIGSSPV